jgi:hypothetical protein
MFAIKSIIYVGIFLLLVVSMFTTYVSLHDSILPEPLVKINLGEGLVWECSVFALIFAVAIGMILLALKLAIMEGHKRLNIMGLLGLTVVGFISISFNLDVLYRTADRDFFTNYSVSKMKGVYEKYLQEAQQKLSDKQETILKQVAKQEGELDAEVKGLRQKPAGYGNMAKQEDYQLTLLQKTSAVDLQAVEDALAKKQDADKLLASTTPRTLSEIQELEHQIRVVIKDVGAASGIPMPDVVKLETPLFAVFNKLFDYHNVGIKEIFFVIVAFFLDLGDIIGYSLIPNRKKSREPELAASLPQFGGPELVMPTHIESLPPASEQLKLTDASAPEPDADVSVPAVNEYPLRRPKRPFRFGRH